MSNTQRDQSGLGVLAEFPNMGIWEAYSPSALFSDVPTDGTAGFAVGCTFIKTNGAAGSEYYINEGSLSSCAFKAVNGLLGADLNAGGFALTNLGLVSSALDYRFIKYDAARTYTKNQVAAVGVGGGVYNWFCCIATTTGHTPPNASFWAPLTNAPVLAFTGSGHADDATDTTVNAIRITLGTPTAVGTNLIIDDSEIIQTNTPKYTSKYNVGCGGVTITDCEICFAHLADMTSCSRSAAFNDYDMNFCVDSFACAGGSSVFYADASLSACGGQCTGPNDGAHIANCGAFGFTVNVTATKAFAFGANITNSTASSTEIGYSDTTKIRIDVNGLNVLGALNASGLLGFRNQPTDTYGAAMTLDVTKSSHVVNASFTTSGTVTYTPSAAGTKGDLLVILTAADASGTVTATFASTFHSSGTQATTASHFSSIMFQSDGTRWVELNRTTNLA